MDKIKPKAVIFDLGSTLIEYEATPWDELGKICVAAARKSMIKKGCELPDEETFHAEYNKVRDRFRKFARKDLIEWDVSQVAAELFKKLGVNGDEKLADQFFDAYYKPVAKQLTVYDDSVATLKRIKDAGIIVGLISNTIFPERAHHEELRRFGLSEFFNFKIFSSTFRLRKPHPDIFYKAVNLAGYAPAESVYIGDRYLEDVQGPNGIGMHSILKVKAGREYPDKMPDAKRRVDTLEELFEHIEV